MDSASNLLDWHDIKTASHPDMHTHPVTQLISHTVLLLKRGARLDPFVTLQEAQRYSVLVSQGVEVLDALWRKHQRGKQDDIVAVVKLMETALDNIEVWFRQGFEGGADAVLAEKRFEDAATRIYHEKGYSSRSMFTRPFPHPTPDELEADRTVLQQDAQRLAEFENLPPEEWLRRASDARRKRAPWEAAAAGLRELRHAIKIAIPLGLQPGQGVDGGSGLTITL